MKRLGKRFLAIVAAVAMVVSMLPQGIGVVQASDATEYEIYPTPHEMTYQDGEFIVRSDVNVVYDSGIDQATKNRMEEVLAIKDKKVSVSEARQDGKTNILVGIYGSDEYVDKYVSDKYTIDTSIFEKFGGHYVISSNNEIVVLGADTDAAFYGITSLKHIFNQMEGSTIRHFTIKDYADTSIRGFIEGYYGIPWSNADRMSLMKFGGEFKMTSYVFAPKDDPYHTSKWRDLYPDKEIAAIAEMVAVGNAAKCKFVWTAHPFMGGFNSNDVDGEIQALLNKFEQLYSVGVRQFGVLGDDVGSLNRNVVIRVMTAVSEWAKEKGDVYDSVFCPAGYNHSWQGDYSELNQYDAGFPEDVQIFWTGEAVCRPVEQKTLDHFRNQNAANGSRRAPLFWLNWPVNDINMSRLMMGKGSLLHTDITIEDLVGVVTNPMQDAEASKVALFAVADYTWNVKDFDDDQSWEDSFKYIDPNASEELYTLAKHMSDPSPNGHGLVLAESEALLPMLDAYKTKLENGSLTAEDHGAMIAEFRKIAEACDAFHRKSQNEKLKEELLPFTNSLRDQALAAIAFINTKAAIDAGNVSEVWSNYSQASALLTSSKNYDRTTLNGTKAALPGSKHITPFLTTLNAQLSPTVNFMIDDSKQIVTLITNRTDTPDGALEKLTDNKESTEVIWKTPTNTTAGTYIGLTYSRPITLNNVTFKMGQSANDRDTFDAGKLQYTVDGKEWIDIGGTEFTSRINEVKAEGLDIEVKGVRIISTRDKENMWLGCKDIIVNAAAVEKPDEPATITGTGIFNEENMVIRNGNLGMFTDGSMSDYAGFAHGATDAVDRKDYTLADAWVGLEFEKVETVSSVNVVQGSGDHIDTGRLEYLNEQDQWTVIDTYTEIGEVFAEEFTPVQAKAIRLVNGQDKAVWWRIYEFSVGASEMEANVNAFHSNTSIYQGSLDKIVDGDESTFIWYSRGAQVGDYIGLDLGKSIKLGEIYVLMDSGDCWTNYDLEYSLDGQTYTKYNSYTGSTLDIDVSSEDITARYVRIYNQADYKNWTKVYEFSVGEQIIRNDAIFTNKTGLTGFSISMNADTATLAGSKEITLAPAEYIGIELDRIKDITDITVTAESVLTLETSKNNVVWTAVSGDNFDDARYIRLMNNTASDVTFTLSKLEVKSHEVYPISVEATNFRQESTHLNAFDHDRTTEAVLQGSQNAGKYITYDLGQVIDLESLKVVLHDGTTDYPRHAKVSVSKDGDSWTEVLLIGSQDSNNPGEEENTDNISELFPDHEISYYTLSKTGINQEVRFIKFEITRDKAGADKWVRIREIELNGGNMYLPSENDPTIVTNGKESYGNVASNMIDGEVSTTFKSSSDKAGSFTYSISENTEIKKITILQSPATISKARVSVEVIENEVIKTIELGRLMSSLNEFSTAKFDHVLSMTVAWDEGSIPEIHEIITSSTPTGEADKAELREYYNSVKGTDASAWTPNSKKAFEDAINTAEYVLGNAYATPNSVRSALAGLKAAVDGKVVKPDMAAFETQLANLVKDVQEDKDYTTKTWKLYAESMAKADVAKENAEISQKDIDAILDEISEAVAQLVYEVGSIEELKVLTTDAKELYKESDYIEDTFAKLTEAIKAAETMIAADAKQRQNPKDVKACKATLEAAIAGLKQPGGEEAKPEIDKTEAKQYYEECIAYYKQSNYTVESWSAYAKAMAALKEALTDKEITVEELQAKIDAVAAAAEKLVKVDGEKPEDTNTPQGSGATQEPKPPVVDNDSNVTTGDTAPVMMWVMLMVCAGVVLVLKRRKSF